VRSTMDMDTTLVHLSLTEEKIKEAMNAIIAVPADDGVDFNFVSVEPIRKDDVYGGFCLRLDAKYESIETPLSIDISTGDVITPEPMNYGYKRLFNSENVIPLRSYPLETVLAEKIETIITRGILNTRPRDFYDVYILTKTQGYNAETLRKAIFATAEHRGTKAIMEAETNNRLAVIENSSELQSQWAKYQKKFSYAKDIKYQETVNAVKEVIHEIYI